MCIRRGICSIGVQQLRKPIPRKIETKETGEARKTKQTKTPKRNRKPLKTQEKLTRNCETTRNCWNIRWENILIWYDIKIRHSSSTLWWLGQLLFHLKTEKKKKNFDQKWTFFYWSQQQWLTWTWSTLYIVIIHLFKCRGSEPSLNCNFPLVLIDPPECPSWCKTINSLWIIVSTSYQLVDSNSNCIRSIRMSIIGAVNNHLINIILSYNNSNTALKSFERYLELYWWT